MPGMPLGKPVGVRCLHLDAQNRCKLFGLPERPAVCHSLRPSADMCGGSREHALQWLGWLERETSSDVNQPVENVVDLETTGARYE